MRRILALVLAVCLLLSGCHLTINLPPKETEASRAQLDFNTLEYVRPDMEGMEALADECLELVGQDGTQTQVLELYDQILDELGNLSTMSSLASVRHDLDLQNSYYEQESLDLDAFYTKFDNRMNELTQAILDSQYAEAAVAAWGQDFVDRYLVNSKLNDPKIEALTERELALENEYSKLLAKEYTTTLDGEEVTIDDLDLNSMAGVNAYFSIYEQKNQELGEIYRELVSLRVEIAKTLGYDSYTDYAYDCLGRDFTKEDAQDFAQKVLNELAPVYSWLDSTYYYDALDAVERSTVGPVEAIPYLRSAVAEEYPAGMAQALEFMLSSNLYTFAGEANMTPGAYTTILEDLHAPYMFINTSLYTDASTLFHEFGHYYNFYLMKDVTWNDNNSLDLAEVHSQGMELLMFESYPEIYGEDAEMMMLYTQLNLLYSVLSGCVEDLFQQRVFEDPDMSLEEMNQLHGELYEQYLGYPVYYEWVDIHHHFETPFYYISYATSAISALELWSVSVEDRARAMEIYDQLTQYTLNVSYLEALEESGLSDPFTSDAVERIGAAIESWVEAWEARPAA